LTGDVISFDQTMCTEARLTPQQLAIYALPGVPPPSSYPGDLVVAEIDWDKMSPIHMLNAFYSVDCFGPHFHAVFKDTGKSFCRFAELDHVMSYCRYQTEHGRPTNFCYASKGPCRYCPTKTLL
jgi:hypothetical protein